MFTHLHVHSHYSLLDGLAKIDELIKKAKEYGMSSLGLTDHGVMYGVIEFYQKCLENKIKPIIGVEFYLARAGREEKKAKVDEKSFHLVLLAKDNQGYKNLIKLVTKAHLEGFYYKPRIDFELLKENNEGLICLIGSRCSEVGELILAADLQKAEKRILDYREIFNEDLYLEVQAHESEDQKKVNEALFSFSSKLNIKPVATNDVHYINKEDDIVQDILLCLQTKKKKEDKDRLCMLGEDYSFKNEKEMRDFFKDHLEVIENTQEIVNKCNLEIQLGEIKLPHFALPLNKTADEYLKELCLEGLKKRYTRAGKDILERLEYELEIIKKTGFAPYFLIVADFVNWAKEKGIVVGPGRGSAASSLVSYLLNITDIDPLKYDLIFERFLNPERISPPDIDLDFADNRRDEVIKYVEEKYGRDHVAQIITFGTMMSRQAVRDVARVLGFSYSYGDRIAKLIPPFFPLDEALKNIPELKEIYEKEEGARRIIEIAKRLEGVARHASTHACGVVIAPEPLTQYLPLQYVSSDDKTIITQYEMHSIEALGLLKMDFLGLKNLTLIENCLKIVEKTKNVKIELDKIPLDDKKTFKLLREGKTTGVFQLESSGMKRYLKQLKPTNIEDVIAMIALFRPGPMDLIPAYIEGKQGKRKPSYLHPKLKPILEKTYGVAIYQEQLLEIAKQLAGFSLGEADILRKAVGKKIPKLLREQKEKFIRGCEKNKIEREKAEKIFDFIEPFAGYGFNKAHSACYATIAYWTAFLKAHYPAEFMCSLLTSDQNDLDRIAIEIEECKQMNIEVLPPDINESFENFTLVGENKIRFGLLAIKNVGINLVREVIKERGENGFYQSLEDFLRRVKHKDLNKKSLESLIKSGALDRFEERNKMLHNIEEILKFAKKIQAGERDQQRTLFGLLPLGTPSLKLKSVRPAEKGEKLAWEKELLGLYLSEHPFREFEDSLRNIALPCNQISSKNASRVKLAGVITKIQKIITRNNETMLFVKIEDCSGGIEVLVFPKLLKNNLEIWQENKIVLIEGRVTDKDGVAKVIVENAQELNSESINKLKIQS